MYSSTEEAKVLKHNYLLGEKLLKKNCDQKASWENIKFEIPGNQLARLRLL